jgi:hypothetical protein
MTDEQRGAFERAPVGLDERITADGSSRWPVEAGRYRLVVRGPAVGQPRGDPPAGPDPTGWLTPHGREKLGGRPSGDGTPPGPPPPG